MLPSEELKSKIVKRYNENPQGWQAFTARDARGHIDTVFVHGEDVYVMKEEVINPLNAVGVGVEEKLNSNLKNSFPSFGFRPLDFRTLDLLMKNEKAQKGVIGELMMRNPVSIPNINAPAVIHGPVTYSNAPLSIMGDKQKDIDSQLRQELNRLLERKYPHLKGMYR